MFQKHVYPIFMPTSEKEEKKGISVGWVNAYLYIYFYVCWSIFSKLLDQSRWYSSWKRGITRQCYHHCRDRVFYPTSSLSMLSSAEMFPPSCATVRFSLRFLVFQVNWKISGKRCGVFQVSFSVRSLFKHISVFVSIAIRLDSCYCKGRKHPQNWKYAIFSKFIFLENWALERKIRFAHLYLVH